MDDNLKSALAALFMQSEGKEVDEVAILRISNIDAAGLLFTLAKQLDPNPKADLDVSLFPKLCSVYLDWLDGGEILDVTEPELTLLHEAISALIQLFVLGHEAGETGEVICPDLSHPHARALAVFAIELCQNQSPQRWFAEVDPRTKHAHRGRMN